MATKHFLHEPNQLVTAALKSLVRTNPSVAVDENYKIVYIWRTKAPQVSIISGGGSGHEPSFAAFVGNGLLSGAVAGSIFASPSAEQIQQCLMRRVENANGILVIIMNYTGDKLHFGIAVEKARAKGIEIDMLVVGDDVGVGRSRGGRIGRRGIAGTVLVQKIAGALAATGASLNEVTSVAKLVSSNIVSVGASLAHVHVPGRAPASDDFNASQDIELGMGIHNEEGFKRLQTDLPGLVKDMLGQLLDMGDSDRAYLNITSSDPVVVLINNLGGVSVLELGGITEEVCSQLHETYSLQPKRIFAGTFMSSLNGLGFSISILKLVPTGLGPGVSMLELLDAPAEATGWPVAVQPTTWSSELKDVQHSNDELEERLQPRNLTLNASQAVKAVRSGLNRLIAAEPEVTKYDTMVGDGDCGLCLKTGAEALLTHFAGASNSTDAIEFVDQIAHVLESNMDGTSGALYTIFLNALAYHLSTQSGSVKCEATAETWAKALSGALKSLGEYTPAKPGDRTVVDALQPFVEVMLDTNDVSQATEAARKGCESTKGMEAQLGRSVYVGGDDWKKCPDPGAFGLVEFLTGMSTSLEIV